MKVRIFRNELEKIEKEINGWLDRETNRGITIKHILQTTYDTASNVQGILTISIFYEGNQ